METQDKDARWDRGHGVVGFRAAWVRLAVAVLSAVSASCSSSHSDDAGSEADAGSQDAAREDGAVACQPSECTASAQCPPGSTCVEVPKTGPCAKQSCCPALGCNPMCPNGVLRDAKGCETCQCAPASSCRVDADCPALELCVPCADAGNSCADYACVNNTCSWVCPAQRDAGAACAQTGESCLSLACCGGLKCCSGVPFPPGTAQCSGTGGCPISDRNLKADIIPVQPEQVLERVMRLQIARWHYKVDAPEVQHIGPMAQDFKAAFDVGADDKHIFQIDADGVSLAAIQALSRRVDALGQAQRALEQENRRLRSEITRLRDLPR